MSDAKPVRPPQVTIAGWMVVAGSVIVVVSAFGAVAGVHSLQTQEAIERYLAEPPGDSLGIGVAAVQTVLRVAGVVSAVCAAVTAILGWSALQRSKGARVALSVLALPLFVSGLVNGGFLPGVVSGGFASSVVCAAIVMMWFQPARDWFDGRTPPPRPSLPTPARDPLLDLPPPTRPPLHAGSPYAAAPAPTAAPVRVGVADERPAAVRAACLITWTFGSLAVVLLALTLVVMISDSGTVIDEARRQNPDLSGQGISDTVLRTSVVVTAAVVLVWSAGAVVLAALAWRRVRWAAVGLLASAALAGLVCLVVTIGSLLMVVPLLGCVATVVLLSRPEARRWFGVRAD